MRDMERRLNQLEARRHRRMIAVTAAEYGLSADDLMAEAEAFFAMPLDQQVAEVDGLAPNLIAEGICTAAELDDIKATLMREYRP
jgi:hypothetical protein